MKVLKIFFIITVSCIVASSLYADIYEWTDENGVKHFSNYSPPDHARVVMKTTELPYDEAADRARHEVERQLQLELARLEIAERKAELARREAEAELRLAEAEQQVKETLREARQYLNTAKTGSDDHLRRFGSVHYGRGYCPPRYHHGFYTRNKTSSINFIRPSRVEHHRHYRLKQYHFGRNQTLQRKMYCGHKRQHKTHPNRNYRRQSLGGGHYHRHLIRSHSGSFGGRRLPGRVRSARHRH
jgi:hypothetical protein